MKRFALILLVLGLIGAGVTAWAYAAWTERGPAATQGNETVILIAPRSRVHDIAAQLQEAHVVDNALLFEFDLRLRRLADKIKAGEYAIPSASSMADIAGILQSGRSIQHKLTAAEGLTSQMIWKLVQADPVLTGDAGAAPDEGTLLPETYLFTRGTTRAELLERMHKAQEKFLEQRWAGRAAGLPFQTPAQALTLASIVEKETALPEERRHIASVFANRLRLGMPLQSDPTIIYDLTQGYPLGRGIRESELKAATPHNTYVIAGLPPGPIANPGKDAIAAVLNPEQTDDLYFVANGSGGHSFSATIAEHERHVLAWRALERRQDNMSPAPDAGAIAPPTLPTAKKTPSKTTPSRRRRRG